MAKKNNTTVIVIIIIASLVIFFPFCIEMTSKRKHKISSVNSAKYQIMFGDDFKKGLSTQDDLGLSIVLAVDCSGSMFDKPSSNDNNPKYISAGQSVMDIINFLEEFYAKQAKKENLKIKIGILKFSSEVNILFGLTEVNETIFKQLKSRFSNPNAFYPQGATAIGKTLEVGTEILAQSGTIFKSLIVITDGQNTSGVYPETVLQAIVDNKNNKSTSDFPVFTSSILVSFIAFDLMDSVYFDKLHKIGSRITYASSKEELDNSLKNIFIADITKLEAK